MGVMCVTINLLRRSLLENKDGKDYQRLFILILQSDTIRERK